MWKVHLECPTPPAYLPTEDVEGKHCAENNIFKWRNKIGNSARTAISTYV